MKENERKRKKEKKDTGLTMVYILKAGLIYAVMSRYRCIMSLALSWFRTYETRSTTQQ